jgi:hypothetical protein
MTRSRSLLWLSLALLLFGSSLLVPDLLLNDVILGFPNQVRTAPPVASSSASLIDPEASAGADARAMDDDAPQRLDVRGNEIARPVARYQVDERGSLYEVHSPETEVPRLKAPLM